MTSNEFYCDEHTPQFQQCLIKKISKKDIELIITKQGIEYKIVGNKGNHSETCVKLNYDNEELYLDSLLLGACKGKSSTNYNEDCVKICHELRGIDFLELVLKLAIKTNKTTIKLIDEAILYEDYFGSNPSFSTMQLLTKKRSFYEGYGYLPNIKKYKEYAYFDPSDKEYLDVFRQFIELRSQILTSNISTLLDTINPDNLSKYSIELIINYEKLQINIISLRTSGCSYMSLQTAFTNALSVFKEYMQITNDDKRSLFKASDNFKKHKDIYYNCYEIVYECFQNFNYNVKYYHVLKDDFNKQILDIYHDNGITVNENFFKTPTEQLGGRKTKKAIITKTHTQHKKCKTKRKNNKHIDKKQNRTTVDTLL